jgi:hypothetical protein
VAFVMVLSWSRQIFLRFYLDQQLANFLRGHVDAIAFFGGIPKVLLYDNLKSAVLERRGDAIRFHPTLLDLSAHYRFEPRPVAVARGNEKGRVERAIRYIRTNYFAARQWRDLDDLNAQALQWCLTTSGNRACPEQADITVSEAFAQERSQLMALPDDAFCTDESVIVTARKTPYIVNANLRCLLFRVLKCPLSDQYLCLFTYNFIVVPPVVSRIVVGYAVVGGAECSQAVDIPVKSLLLFMGYP